MCSSLSHMARPAGSSFPPKQKVEIFESAVICFRELKQSKGRKQIIFLLKTLKGKAKI